MELDRMKSRAQRRARGEYRTYEHVRPGVCFAQHDQNIANDTGAAVRSDINNALAALFGLSSGAAAPATTIAYMLWADTTLGVLKQRNAANTGWLVRGTLAETFILARSSNTILAGGDFARTFIATSSFTQTLTAAATLGDGWFVYYRNDGTGVIVIDPNGAETIDGAATLVLNPGESCAIFCNGSAFKTIGRGLAQGSHAYIDNLTFVASVSGNALTVALKTRNGNDPTTANPIKVPFRSATAATGDFTEIDVTAATSITMSSGSTGGAVNGVAFRFWLVAFNDAGTFRPGLINCLSTVAGAGAGRDVTAIYPLRSWGIASSTAEGGGGAADSAQTFYTGTAVTSKAYVVLGYVSYEGTGLAAAGTYASAPTRVQLLTDDTPLPGDLIQVQRTDTGAVSTGTTVTPNDDSIPQITEGDQAMSQAITPTSAANALLWEVKAWAANNSAGDGQIALHQDATANALKSGLQNAGAAGITQALSLSHFMQAATTSSTTGKVRIGYGGAGTTTFNGVAGGRKHGGTLNSYTQCMEIMA